VPEGERCKTSDTLEQLLDGMLRAGFTRGDCVCAVGGGAVGDLAGLAAALYMRGVDFYNFPTTLLSQADSCVGGKTGIDLAGVKNAAGVIRQPKKVLIDADTLTTLPWKQLACGLAEALKAGLIGDASLLTLLESLPESEMSVCSFEQVAAAALRVKIRIVEQDVSERGARRALNFGHTIGHAIESVTGLPHGECVALGMLPMVPPALRARLERINARMGLPTAVQADPEAVYMALLHDKKMEDGRVMAVFVETPGQYTVRAVPPETFRTGIETVVKV
jgi:3-dehydroquinate synthase